MQNFYTENCKTSLREILKGVKKWSYNCSNARFQGACPSRSRNGSCRPWYMRIITWKDEENSWYFCWCGKMPFRNLFTSYILSVYLQLARSLKWIFIILPTIFYKAALVVTSVHFHGCWQFRTMAVFLAITLALKRAPIQACSLYDPGLCLASSFLLSNKVLCPYIQCQLIIPLNHYRNALLVLLLLLLQQMILSVPFFINSMLKSWRVEMVIRDQQERKSQLVICERYIRDRMQDAFPRNWKWPKLSVFFFLFISLTHPILILS